MNGRKHSLLRKLPQDHSNSGFTIVELLVVIVVIGILAAITIVAYTGISQKAIVSSLQSDLVNSSKKLKLYQVLHGAYPTLDGGNCPTSPTDTNYCLKASSGNNYTSFQPDNTSHPQTFCLTAMNTNGINYHITDSSAPTAGTPSVGTCDGVMPDGSTCPSNFIVVPGSSTYGTSTFCVMKYEAKNVGGIATSQAAGTPWVSIPQTGAGSATSLSTAACSGCHLITESEWLTIAQNVLDFPSNWSTGTVGSGYIYSGHNDNAPANALAADTSDSNGYAGETNTGGNQRRTLTLTNGQVIWDLAGNVWEWTSGQQTGGQPAGMASWGWYQWTAVSGGTFAVNPYPSGTGISGSSGWDSTKGIGQIYGLSSDASLRGFLRGGGWNLGGVDGVLTLNLSAPSNTNATIGFRVSR